MKRTVLAAIHSGVFAASVFSAAAGQVGPGLNDLPPQPRPIAAVERELDEIDAQLAAALAVDPRPAGTPLGAPPQPSRQGTALITPDAPAGSHSQGLGRTVLALAGVVAMILGLSWLFKRASRAAGGISGSLGAGGRAPAGIVEILARYPVASRHTLVVLRFDRRVLLCSMTGSTRSAGAGMTVLCELDEPEDVASVLIKTRDEAGETIARSFERSLRDAERLTREAEEIEPVRVRMPQPSATPSSAPRSISASRAGQARQSSPLRRGLDTLRAAGPGGAGGGRR